MIGSYIVHRLSSIVYSVPFSLQGHKFNVKLKAGKSVAKGLTKFSFFVVERLDFIFSFFV